jgi:hypothetical protein
VLVVYGVSVRVLVLVGGEYLLTTFLSHVL